MDVVERVLRSALPVENPRQGLFRRPEFGSTALGSTAYKVEVQLLYELDGTDPPARH